MKYILPTYLSSTELLYSISEKGVCDFEMIYNKLYGSGKLFIFVSKDKSLKKILFSKFQ